MPRILPSKREYGGINGPTIAFILVLVVGVFLVLTFVPPWYKTLTAKERIGEVISGMSAAGADEEGIQEKIVEALNAMGVDVGHGDVEVRIEKKTRFANVSVNWKATIRYPLIRKTTSIHFAFKVRRKLS